MLWDVEPANQCLSDRAENEATWQPVPAWPMRYTSQRRSSGLNLKTRPAASISDGSTS
jgi:hypothetical protein